MACADDSAPTDLAVTGSLDVTGLPSVSQVVKKALPAVVNISTSQKRPPRQEQPTPRSQPEPFGRGDPFEEFFRRFFGERMPHPRQRSLGSGFVISADGYIVTNNHVIAEADKVTVRFESQHGREYEAKVIGTDEKTDLALIKIEPQEPLPTVPFGSSTALEVGDWVVAIGNPFGLEQTVTVGIVSAKGRVIRAGPYDDFIQTDASINPGNSGGPLLNLQGQVIGVNSAIFSRGGGNIGIGFAIPIDLAKTVLDQLKETGAVTRAWLGVIIQTVTKELAKSFGLQEARGALVSEVVEGGPAEGGGLQRGDVIIGFNETPVETSRELPRLVAQAPVGSQAQVTILRNGKEQTVTITLGQMGDQQVAASSRGGATTEAQWGMTVANQDAAEARALRPQGEYAGVVVITVEPGSSAAAAGLRPGDLIEEINRQPVKSLKEFTEVLASATKRGSVLLLVRRGHVSSFYALRNAEE
ncbi:MAG: DegQ family serine endoprotease [Candidatus Binatia bacterium]